jgi:pimeloyl-ACP methyl ester carboxylesterase
MAKTAGVAYDRRGTGEPLLLIHGTGGSRAHWAPVVDLLAPHRDLLVVDLPGHGESDSPPAGVPHNPIGYARSLAALLDELGIDAAHAAGNSVGGWTALELAKAGRARSVAAIAPAGLWPRKDPWRCVMQLRGQHRMGRLFAPVVPTLLRSDLGRTMLMRNTVAKPRDLPAEAAVEMAETFARTPAFAEHIAATRNERFRDGTAITVPVTVAWGDKERLIPRKARRTDELPEQTRFVTLDDCGHSPMWDAPELVARVILQSASPADPKTAAVHA